MRVKKVELITFTVIAVFDLARIITSDHWRTFDPVVTVGDQRRPVFRANFLDPIPSHHYSYSAMQADGCPST